VNLGSRPDNDYWNRSAFEALLLSVKNGGEDPIVFIRDKIYEKHISGNHRWFIKERYRQVNKDKFDKNPYWHLTLAQVYVGLRLIKRGKRFFLNILHIDNKNRC
jgi:hypothetical protein